MKKFSFSLQRLLNYKEQLFENERNILAEMRAVLSQLEQELNDMKNEHLRRVAEYNEKIIEGLLPAEMQTHKYYLMVLDEGIRDKIEQIKLQQQAVDRQMDIVREAKLEISTIEKLKEKKLEEYIYTEAKADEQFINEFVTNQRSGGDNG